MLPVSDWQPAPQKLILSSSEVHLWRLSLPQPHTRLAALEALLSPDEIARADRFAFPQMRANFISVRGMLRQLLGIYTHTSPATLSLAYAEHGKPHLPNSEVRFNISHTHELALLAFARGLEVGVDVEHIRPVPDTEAIVRQFFSPYEVEAFIKVSASLQMHAFFNCWTRKEAFIKALGKGLSIPLHTFDVTITPGEPALLLAFRGAPEILARWKILAIDLGPNYVSSVVAEGRRWKIRLFDLGDANLR